MVSSVFIRDSQIIRVSLLGQGCVVCDHSLRFKLNCNYETAFRGRHTPLSLQPSDGPALMSGPPFSAHVNRN